MNPTLHLLRAARIWLLAGAVLAASGCSHHKPLPKIGTVPDFHLVDQKAQAFPGSAMDGHVWVVDFFFTSCVTYCPLMTEHMRQLREKLHGDGVRFMSISVDPDHDTPKVLEAYARKHHAAHDDWVFLTGDTAAVSRAVVKGFKLPMGKPVPRQGGNGYNILHARYFLLVDGHRRIRGYYTSDQLAKLTDDAGRLAGGKA